MRQTIVLFLMAIGIGAGAPAPAAADEPTILRVDFRGNPIDDNLFERFGDRGQIRTEPEGLRITLPPPDGIAQDTGLRFRPLVTGDFEVAVTYELITADIPKDAFGVGVTLHCMLQDEAATSPFMGRFNLQNGTWYTCNRGAFDAAGKRNIEGKRFRSDAKSGRLRLTRRGSVVTSSVADVGSDDFRRLWDWEVGTADVKLLRIQAENQKSDAPLDVRFLDFEIRSGNPRDLAVAPDSLSRGWKVVLEILGLIVLVLILALWHRNRRQRAANNGLPTSHPTEARA